MMKYFCFFLTLSSLSTTATGQQLPSEVCASKLDAVDACLTECDVSSSIDPCVNAQVAACTCNCTVEAEEVVACGISNGLFNEACDVTCAVSMEANTTEMANGTMMMMNETMPTNEPTADNVTTATGEPITVEPTTEPYATAEPYATVEPTEEATAVSTGGPTEPMGVVIDEVPKNITTNVTMEDSTNMTMPMMNSTMDDEVNMTTTVNSTESNTTTTTDDDDDDDEEPVVDDEPTEDDPDTEVAGAVGTSGTRTAAASMVVVVWVGTTVAATLLLL